MTDLEKHYRRLLRAYPPGHRADYEDEMIGVLMSGAGPGRRFPAPADALDLLRAGLTARFGHGLHTQRGTGWRAAAAVVGLFAALVLAAAAAGRLAAGLVLRNQGDPLRAHGVDGLMLLEPAARTVVWAVVAAAAMLGLRRTAAVAAAAGVLIQVATLGFWSAMMPAEGLQVIWGLATALAAAGLFAAATAGRPVPAVLGIRGLVIAVAGAALVAVTRVLLGDSIRLEPWIGGQIFPLENVVRFGLPALVLAAAAWSAGRRVRARVAILSAVLLTGVFAADALGFLAHEWHHAGPSTGTAVTAAVVLVLPVVVLATGVTLLRTGERLAARGHGHVRAYE